VNEEDCEERERERERVAGTSELARALSMPVVYETDQVRETCQKSDLEIFLKKACSRRRGAAAPATPATLACCTLPPRATARGPRLDGKARHKVAGSARAYTTKIERFHDNICDVAADNETFSAQQARGMQVRVSGQLGQLSGFYYWYCNHLRWELSPTKISTLRFFLAHYVYVDMYINKHN